MRCHHDTPDGTTPDVVSKVYSREHPTQTLLLLPASPPVTLLGATLGGSSLIMQSPSGFPFSERARRLPGFDMYGGALFIPLRHIWPTLPTEQWAKPCSVLSLAKHYYWGGPVFVSPSLFGCLLEVSKLLKYVPSSPFHRFRPSAVVSGRPDPDDPLHGFPPFGRGQSVVDALQPVPCPVTKEIRGDKAGVNQLDYPAIGQLLFSSEDAH